LSNLRTSFGKERVKKTILSACKQGGIENPPKNPNLFTPTPTFVSCHSPRQPVEWKYQPSLFDHKKMLAEVENFKLFDKVANS